MHCTAVRDLTRALPNNLNIEYRIFPVQLHYIYNTFNELSAQYFYQLLLRPQLS